MGKAKKIIAGVLVVAVAGTGIGAGLMQLRKNSQKEVEVTPVSGLLQEYYQQSTNLDGQIASSATQTVTGDKDLVVDQVFVSKGDNVKKDGIKYCEAEKTETGAGSDKSSKQTEQSVKWRSCAGI